MNKSVRCEVRDKDGHRCNKRAGHDRPDADTSTRLHLAFGRLFPGPIPTEESLEAEPVTIPAPEFVP